MSALKALAALVTAGLSVLYVVMVEGSPTLHAALAAVWAFTAGVWLSNLIFTWGER